MQNQPTRPDDGLQLSQSYWEEVAAPILDASFPVPDTASVAFSDRPYSQVDPRLVPGLVESIGDPDGRALPVGLGSIEQRTDNVDVLVVPHRRRAVVRFGPVDPNHASS